MKSIGFRTATLLNVALYYSGWLACVIGAAQGRWIAGALVGLALVIVHVALSRDSGTEVRLMLPVLVVGVTVDSAQTALGLLRFDSGQPVPWLAPVWIGVMWLLFSATLRYAFHPFGDKRALSVLLGAAGGPAAFYAGHRLGAVDFHPLAGLSLVVLAIVWSVLFPALMWLARGLGGEGPGRYRISS